MCVELNSLFYPGVEGIYSPHLANSDCGHCNTGELSISYEVIARESPHNSNTFSN
jgi:hypothetical protein